MTVQSLYWKSLYLGRDFSCLNGSDLQLVSQHMTSSNGNIFCITGPLCGQFTGELPAQRPVTWSFDVFFDLHLNERLSKQLWGWWFEMPSHPLWCHCKGLVKDCREQVQQFQVWWLCLVPTSTTRFANDVNTVFPHKFWRPFLDSMPQLFFRPQYVWFPVHLKGLLIPLWYETLVVNWQNWLFELFHQSTSVLSPNPIGYLRFELIRGHFVLFQAMKILDKKRLTKKAGFLSK